MVNEHAAKEIGRLIAEIRAVLHITQQQLADAVLVSRETIAQIETGKARLSEERLAELTAGLVSHVEAMGDARISPVLIFSLKSLLAALGGAVGEDQTGAIVFVAQETNEVFPRISASLMTGDFSPIDVLAPLIGLLLLYPDLETSLLLYHMTRCDPGERSEVFTQRLFLRALYVADGILQSLGGEPSIKNVARQEAAASPPLKSSLATIRDAWIVATGEPSGDDITAFLDDVLQ
jgi:transcriptional regulator with XRE-family HTH domain